MFIQNFEAVENRYKCKKIVGEYIYKNFNIPPLSISNEGDYIFSNTDTLKKAVDELPFYIRVLC